MIVSRFGTTWAAGYELGQIKGESVFPISRAPSIAQVGGVAGAFDYYGDDNFPLAPQVVTHAFNLSAANWAAVEAALDTLKKRTIGAGRSKLWGLCRDNSHRWAWAKCIGLETSEVNRSYLRIPVKASFQLTEGLWYGDTMHDNSYMHTVTFYCPNYGSFRASLRTRIRPIIGNLTSFTMTNADNGDTWTYTGAIPEGQFLVVDSGKYQCTVNDVGAYSGLAIGSGQVQWLALEPGAVAATNNITVNWTPGATVVWIGTQWWDTYL